MIKLIATDMDGTFLDSKGSYDKERFIKILDALETRGIQFVVATGNSMKRLEMLFDGLTDRMDFVAENGAHIMIEGQTLSKTTIAEGLVEEALQFFAGKERDYSLSLTSDVCTYMLRDSSIPDFDGIEPEQLEAMRNQIHHLRSWGEIAGPIFKMNLTTNEAEAYSVVSDFNRIFNGRLKAVTSGYGGVDIMVDGCNKATGLERVLDHFKLTPEQVMSFGDSDNDLEMLAISGESYAMLSAPANVKAVAKHEAPHHDDNGVFQVIEAFLKEDND